MITMKYLIFNYCKSANQKKKLNKTYCDHSYYWIGAVVDVAVVVVVGFHGTWDNYHSVFAE